jgi:transposase-like protein
LRIAVDDWRDGAVAASELVFARLQCRRMRCVPTYGRWGGLHLRVPERRAVRTTNAVERRFREVRRRTRPMGTFQDKTSMDRILFAVFTHENKSQGVSTPFLLTQNN